MAEKVAALQKMQAENMHHYDAHCPRCGRANAVSRERLEMFTPGWQEAITETASEPAPVSSSEPAAPKLMPSEPAPVLPVKAPAKPAAKKPAAKKPAKPAAKKPAKKVVKAKSKPKKAVKKTAAKKTKRKK